MLENLTLLFVEDNKDMQEYMKIFLAPKVKNFYQAFDGEEGLKIFKEKKPDIVITDICMPKLDGLEMVQDIKEKDSNVCVVVISAFDDKSNLIKAINMGVDYFIPKPIDLEVVLNKLKDLAHNLENRLYINKIQEQIHNLKKLAYYDSLTRIYNRISFDEHLNKLIQKSQKENIKFSLLFIDLDNFKVINDNYGHKVGDEVLKQAVYKINQVIRTTDIFARIGGDEFAIIINTAKQEILDYIAKKIIESVHNIHIENIDIKIGCSIGISSFPKDSIISKNLIHFADLAMYEAKRTGKSTYKYFSNIKGYE